MNLNHSPRKTVPLATGDEDRTPLMPRSAPALTNRVFFCGVVVENPGFGRQLPQDVQDLVASLGDPVELDQDESAAQATSESTADPSNPDGPHVRRRALTNISALADVINEFVSTERSYVKRLYSLKHDYADPLRTFSRSKDTAIIPPYEAKTLFGNIDQILPVNQAFLEDLELMMLPNGPETVGGIGDVALKHFKQLKGFENYKGYYAKREEAQAIFEKEMKRGSGFSAFIDRIKYSSTDTKNRVGLRELLMDPVQRIPRYTLMFRTMMKHMAPSDPQQPKLLEADEIASKIALAETDDKTKQATIMYCLSATIDEFPAWLMSHSRRKFVDCIDVEDVPSDSLSNSSYNYYAHSRHGSSASGGGRDESTLYCTLFLFDDKVMIVKRPEGKSGGALSGLNDLGKFTKSGLPSGLKKNGMVCKGIVDVTDIVVTDVGGPDLHIYLESPPLDQGERWSGRPFRALSVVHPPNPVNLDPSLTNATKQRFLENLWSVQARYRTRLNQSVLLCAEEREVENRGGKLTRARTYFNVYQRTAFLKEEKKTKIALHIDPTGAADPLPFGMRAPPFVVVRVQPMAGELSRYTVTSNDPNDEPEEDIVQTGRVPDRIVQTIHQFGLFKFKTGNISMPATPTASSRSRAALFSLDAVTRNLFGALPGSSKGDIFGGSINSHRRTKTMASRSSASTNSTNSGDTGSLSRFTRTRSNSTATSLTSVSMADDDDVSTHTGKGSSRHRSITRKLMKRPKSPGAGTVSESDAPSPGPSSRRAASVEVGGGSESEEDEDEDRLIRGGAGMSNLGPFANMRRAASEGLESDESERNLAARLALARKNSRNQHETVGAMTLEGPTEETIYEDHPPTSLRPSSRLSRDLPDLPNDTESQHSTIRPDRPSSRASYTSYADSTNTYRASARPPTRQSLDERRPLGPRAPSPLPPPSPRLSSSTNEPHLSRTDSDMGLGDATLVNPMEPVTPRRNRAMSMDDPLAVNRTWRPFVPGTGNMDATPKASTQGATDSSGVEPLSIRKKAFSPTSMSPFNPMNRSGDESPTRRQGSSALPRTQALHKLLPQLSTATPTAPTSNTRSSVATSPTKRLRIPMSSDHAAKLQEAEQLTELALTTKEDIESAHRTVKRIRLEAGQMQAGVPGSPPSDIERAGSPVKSIRTPPARVVTQGLTREAQARMEEMRKLISRRHGETTPRGRPFSVASESPVSRTMELPRFDDSSRTVEELALQADQELSKAAKDQERIHSELIHFTEHLKETSADLERTRLDLEGAKRQCEVVKSLLSDATDEKEIMYTSFNEELEGMYEAANSLPPDDAWAVMSKDLRETKEARNTFAKENSHLKRRLAELELQNEEWGNLLRAYGLIS